MEKIKYKKKCAGCGKRFKSVAMHKRYCSGDCDAADTVITVEAAEPLPLRTSKKLDHDPVITMVGRLAVLKSQGGPSWLQEVIDYLAYVSEYIQKLEDGV